MNRVFVIELPFDYSLYLTTNELIFCGLLVLLVAALVLKSMFLRVQGGREALVEQCVEVLEDFDANCDGKFRGQVLCLGEIWNAQADKPLKKGDRSVVDSSEGLTLILKK